MREQNPTSNVILETLGGGTLGAGKKSANSEEQTVKYPEMVGPGGKKEARERNRGAVCRKKRTCSLKSKADR